MSDVSDMPGMNAGRAAPSRANPRAFQKLPGPAMSVRSGLPKVSMMAVAEKQGFRENLLTFLYGESRHKNNVAQVPVRSGAAPSQYPPSEVTWSKGDTKMAKELAFKHQEKSIKKGPTVEEGDDHHFDYDYT